MKRLALLLIPAALLAGDTRYARLGEMEGSPEVQFQAAYGWQPAARNMLLLDGTWVRTGKGARAEIELDEGSAIRLDAEALCELSDYTRLSTGQRVTLISLDHGLAYFTGAAQGRDSLVLAVPGAQIAVRRGSRVRLEAGETSSQMAVLEGAVTFSSPAAELDIKEGQMVRVEPANPSRFFLYREIPALESDKWSEARDKALMTGSAGHVASPPFGLADLDASGNWIETAAWGTVWKPKIAAGWAPFRSGRWTWYDGIGYTWISAESWGWLPYHYGRWALDENAGWVWAPGKDAVFSPGDVYWLRGPKLAGWGPLGPAEQWDGRSQPQLFLKANSTFAAFVPEMRGIDPAGFTPPKEPLAAAAFTTALPSPALPAARLEARRPVLRAGSTRVAPYLSGVTFQQASEVDAGIPAGGHIPETASGAPYVNTTVIQPAPPPPVVLITPPPEPPVEYYPVPVYTGIVVVNPPERKDSGRRGPVRRPDDPPTQPAPNALPSAEQRKTNPQPAPQPPPAQAETPRASADQRRHEPAPQPPAHPPAKPIAAPSEQPKTAPPPPPAAEKPAEKPAQRSAEPARPVEKPAVRNSEPAPRADPDNRRRPDPQ